MLVVYRIQNSILSKIKYNLFFIDTLVIECCQIVGNNTAYRHLYGHLYRNDGHLYGHLILN